ncbi:MAG TPA: hypothetical protein VJC15_01875 [Candidatus Paceibacterota bacterium]
MTENTAGIEAVFVVDTSLPSVPEEWKGNDWEIEEHKPLGVGKVEVTFRNGKMFINGQQVDEYLSKEQKAEQGYVDGGNFVGAILLGEGYYMNGYELLKELTEKIVLPDAILDLLIREQNHPAVATYLRVYITPSQIRFPSFWGTRYRTAGTGETCVRGLFWANDEWMWIQSYLHNPWFWFFPALVLEHKA